VGEFSYESRKINPNQDPHTTAHQVIVGLDRKSPAVPEYGQRRHFRPAPNDVVGLVADGARVRLHLDLAVVGLGPEGNLGAEFSSVKVVQRSAAALPKLVPAPLDVIFALAEGWAGLHFQRIPFNIFN
jgi:hypothetical protein